MLAQLSGQGRLAVGAMIGGAVAALFFVGITARPLPDPPPGTAAGAALPIFMTGESVPTPLSATASINSTPSSSPSSAPTTTTRTTHAAATARTAPATPTVTGTTTPTPTIPATTSQPPTTTTTDPPTTTTRHRCRWNC